jgi:protein phosphatase
LRAAITVREENATAALELMSRFAINPKWLIYLPPTMSPPETSEESDWLEHPAQAFAYYRRQQIAQVVCEEKHMGSRAVVIVCRDHEVALRRFGVQGGGLGAIHTRTGRPFFSDASVETQLLIRLCDAATHSGLWDELHTDWLCLDCELLPWSAKAQELLRTQYASVGAAARAALPEVLSTLSMARSRGIDVMELERKIRRKHDAALQFVEAYRRYCWHVHSISDLKLAPFHLLASEGMNWRSVDLSDAGDEAAATDWWLQLTEQGGEGMVVKPANFTQRGKKGLVQPAIKCRGREYLRIIYGPDYAVPENLNRLRIRGLARKRALALSEFALGIEALDRFVRREPLRHVHECVFAVLALESEPVDPRL